MPMAQAQAVLCDQDIMDDMLSSEKAMTGLFNTFANECVHQTLRNDMLNILRENHMIQADLFTEMQKRGWYNPPAADQQMINQDRTKFQNIAQNL